MRHRNFDPWVARFSSRRLPVDPAPARNSSIPRFLEILSKCQNFEDLKSQAAPQQPQGDFPRIPNIIPMRIPFAPRIFKSSGSADRPTYEKLIFENLLEILTLRNFDILSKFREDHQKESKWGWGRSGCKNVAGDIQSPACAKEEIAGVDAVPLRPTERDIGFCSKF